MKMSKYNKYEFMYEFVVFDDNPYSSNLDDFKKVKFYKALKSDAEAFEFHTEFLKTVLENNEFEPVEDIYDYYVYNCEIGEYVINEKERRK